MLIRQDTTDPTLERSSLTGSPLRKAIPGHRAGMTLDPGLGLPQETGPDTLQMTGTGQMITKEPSRPRCRGQNPPPTQQITGRVEIPTRAAIGALKGQIPPGEFTLSCRRD